MIPADLVTTVRTLEDRARRSTRSPDAMCVFVEAGSAWCLGPDQRPRRVPAQVWPVVAQTAATGQRAFLGRALIEPIGAWPVRAVLVLRRPPAAGSYGAHEVAAIGAITTDVAATLGGQLAAVGSPLPDDPPGRATTELAEPTERWPPPPRRLEPVLFAIALRVAAVMIVLAAALSLYRLSVRSAAALPCLVLAVMVAATAAYTRARLQRSRR